jgi:hypothetical protein
MTHIDAFKQKLNNKSEPSSSSADEVLNALEQTLLEQKEYHRLFDARMMRVRRRMELPLTQPASINGVPAEKEAEFREAYMAVAREVGKLFLEDHALADAWAYFRTIGDPAPVKQALEELAAPTESGSQLDDLISLALYEGAHIVLGLRLLLRSHGTCNTITAMGQLMSQMTPAERNQSAALMVKHLYTDLQYSLTRHTESREPEIPKDLSIAELVSGRSWLFEEGNYHIDISHLHSTVGFARHLTSEDPELLLAIELCQYGRQLDSPLRYPGEVPFDDFYTAHSHFLKAIAGIDVDAALACFAERLTSEADPQNQKLTAFVIVDLGQRTGRVSQTLEMVGQHLSRLEDQSGFSWSTACLKAGRSDLLARTAQHDDDVLTYALSLLENNTVAG